MKNISLAIALLCGTASASTIDFNYSGTITRSYYAQCTDNSLGYCQKWINNSEESLEVGKFGRLSVGDKFSGRLVYDTDSSNPQFAGPENRQAIYYNIKSVAFESLGITLPAKVLPYYSGAMWVYNSTPGAADTIGFWPSFSDKDWYYSQFLSFYDVSGEVNSSFEIPASINLGDWSYSSFELRFLEQSSGDQYAFSGTFSSLFFTESRISNEIPEPPTSALAILSLFIIASGIHRRRSRDLQTHVG